MQRSRIICGVIAAVVATLCAIGVLSKVHLGDSSGAVDHSKIGKLTRASGTPAVQAHLPDEKQALVLEKAKIVLISQCMKRLGIKFAPKPAINPVYESLWKGGGLPTLSVRKASKYGYHPAPLKADGNTAEQSKKPANSEKTSSVSKPLKQWQKDAVYGSRHQVNGKPVPNGGCFGESQRILFKSTDQLIGDTGELKGKVLTTETDVLNAMLELLSIAGDRMNDDPRYRQTLNQWSLCMDKAGYNKYRSISDAALSSEWGQSASATKNEKSVATADAHCRIKANYRETFHALNETYQKQVASEHKQFLDTVTSNLNTRLQNAKRVLRDKQS